MKLPNIHYGIFNNFWIESMIIKLSYPLARLWSVHNQKTASLSKNTKFSFHMIFWQSTSHSFCMSCNQVCQIFDFWLFFEIRICNVDMNREFTCVRVGYTIGSKNEMVCTVAATNKNRQIWKEFLFLVMVYYGVRDYVAKQCCHHKP